MWIYISFDWLVFITIAGFFYFAYFKLVQFWAYLNLLYAITAYFGQISYDSDPTRHINLISWECGLFNIFYLHPSPPPLLATYSYSSEKLESKMFLSLLASVQCLTTDWKTGWPEFDPRQRQKIFTRASVSRASLRPTHPPGQGVRGGGISPGVKRGRGVIPLTPSSAEVKNE
jgi:hypothetical protein